MRSAARFALQIAFLAVFAAFIGWLSASPPYHYASADMATIKLSLSHAGNRVKPCERLTPEEVAKLAPNMRQVEKCERERLPVVVELLLDGTKVIRVEAAPSGVWNDGPSSVYESFEWPPGTYELTARLRDSNRAEGWDYAASEQVELRAGRYFTVTFKEDSGGFRIP